MTKPTLLLLFAFALPLPVLAGPSPRPVSATLLGFTAPKAISVGFTTDPIDMQLDGGTYTRLSMPLTVVWGTTTALELRLLESDTETGTYSVVTRCTSAAAHVCAPRRWTFASSAWSGLTPRLDFVGARARFLKVQIVAGAGTGTVLATATRAP